jgi:hypothetical protein
MTSGTRTELDGQTRRILASPRQHLALNLHAVGARIWWYEREEEAGGFRAQGEGVEGDADLGEETSYHYGGGKSGGYKRQGGGRN